MAICPGFPGLEVTVTVDGNLLYEYDLPDNTDEIESDVSAIKYIEAQPGVEFAVHIKLDPAFEYNDNDIYVKVLVDGKDYLKRARYMRKAAIIDTRTETFIGPLLVSGKNIIERNWIFSTLKTVSSPMKEPESDLLDRFNGLGQIIVVMHRITIGQEVELDLKTYEQNTSEIHEKIPEKALKGRALSRKAGLGVARLYKNTNGHNYTWIDAKNEPFATFTFRYRSMDDLHAERIVPKPIPLEEREYDTLTMEEMRELLSRQEKDLERQKLKHQLEKNRRKLSGAANAKRGEKKEVKKESKRGYESAFGRGSSSNAPKRRQVETIDLAGDEEKEVEKEIKRERDSAFGGSSNLANSTRRQNKTIDLTHD